MKRLYLATILVILASSMPAFCAKATLDVAKQTFSSDAATLECMPPRLDGEQIGLYIISKTMQPQAFKLEAKGLNAASYDIYVCGSYTGKRTAKQLSDGIELNVPGTVDLQNYMRCLIALKDKIKPEIDRLSKIHGSEPQRVLWTLARANDWVKLGIVREGSYRSLSIIVTPEGSALKTMLFKIRADAEGTTKNVSTACSLLQQARARMYENIKDPALRNKAVEVMTPVAFSAKYQLVKGKPSVTAIVKNDCNLPISGDITFALPKGWKADSKQLAFTNLESGQTYKTTFKLIAPSKSAKAPEVLPIAANSSLKEGKYAAKLKLKIVQMLGS